MEAFYRRPLWVSSGRHDALSSWSALCQNPTFETGRPIEAGSGAINSCPRTDDLWKQPLGGERSTKATIVGN
jgi:hypothetical protein